MAMKVLMTGASGPKVGHVVAAALTRCNELIGLDARPGANTSLVADMREIDDWSAHLEGIDAVVHFAALHAPDRETRSREEFLAINVEATRRLIESARRCGVGKFVLASTTSVYGKAMRTTGRAAWVTEALQPVAEDVYDETKLAAEQLCRENFSREFQTVALRFSRCFPEPLPLMAVYRLHRGIDARDVASAFALALQARLEAFEAINISGATPFLEEECEELWHDAPAVLRRRVPGLVEEFGRRGWELPGRIDRVYAIDKANVLLGFTPLYLWDSLVC
jgi:UDP-glucose 4-epimerase